MMIEKSCIDCAHKEVCQHKEFLKSVERRIFNTPQDGDKAIVLDCKYYKQEDEV